MVITKRRIFVLYVAIMMLSCLMVSSPSIECAQGVATLQIIGDQGEILKETEYAIVKGDTALGILKRTGIRIGIKKYTFGDFVEAIDGIACKDSSGWTYEVNKITPDVGASSYELKSGDKVVWKYIKWG